MNKGCHVEGKKPFLNQRTLAQLVEWLSCKTQVVGSTLARLVWYMPLVGCSYVPKMGASTLQGWVCECVHFQS